jgi:glutamyl-tRNA reductase
MSERLFVIATSFRRVGFVGLGGYTLPLEGTAELAGLRDACGAAELVYVATCNRVEAYISVEDPAATPASILARAAAFFASRHAGAVSAEHLFVLEGAAAVEHLFGVVSSLDSLVLGECEIAGQVRRAAESARALGLAGPVLRRLFEQAAKVARRVRADTAIGRTPVSVASLVLRRIREHFGDAKIRAVLVGVNDVTKKIATSLEKRAEITFVNRTESRARELAARHGGAALSLEQFRATPPAAVDLVVCATRAPGAVVDAATLALALAARPASAPALLVCDLGVPADVCSSVDALAGARVLRLPDLEATARENRERLAGEAEHARAVVAEEARRAVAESRLRALAAESADALLEGRLAHLAPADREAVRRFATGLAERLARQPAA